MPRQSLKSFGARLGVEPGALLAAAGIDETRRAEEVDVQGFVALAEIAKRFTKPVNAAASACP